MGRQLILKLNNLSTILDSPTDGDNHTALGQKAEAKK